MMPVRARSPLDRVADALTLLTAALLFGVSAMTLSALGVAYDQAGGSFLQKFHPATYMASLALAVRFIARARPLGWLAEQTARFPGATYFVTTWIVMIVFAAVAQKAPISPIIDSFLCSVAFLVLYADADERTRATMRVALHAFMFVNACIGIVEFVTHWRLTPYVAAGKVILHDYRSTALLGHPLVNAAVGAAYVLMLLYGADRAVGWGLRLVLVGVQLASFVTFGGRTAIVLSVALGAPRLARPALEVLAGRRFDMRAALVAALSAPVLLAAIVLLAQRGTFDGLLERFADDKGSADARLLIFQLFDYFSFDELLFGPDQQRLASIQNTLGIEYGIESSWFGFLFGYGAFMTLFFLAAFAALMWEFWRRSRPGAWALFLYILVQLSSAAGISVKSLVFDQFVVLLLAFFC
ncbi:MAG: VpsF family polysaccharide biosynthesis protein, partial [Rhodoblastus sp.]|nr:VpsF family polysaccharide biosynthesis protein [Rhodoblastus sp.]